MAVAEQASLLREYDGTLGDLSAVFYARLVELVGRLPAGSKAELRSALIEAFPELLYPFMESSAQVGASFYEASRAASIGGRTFLASPAPVELAPAAVDGLARYAVSPLDRADGMRAVTAILAGAAQRNIFNSARDSIGHNVALDETAYGYARKPSPGCCEFCAMLSTRVYDSMSRAVSVSGNQRRNTQAVGKEYHDFCRCTAVPVFGTPGSEFDDVISVNPDAGKYLDIYKQAQEMSGDAGGGEKNKAVLANMRMLMNL